MFKVGEIVVYKKEVCKIKEIKEKYMQGRDYYIMHPIEDPSLVINVPIDNEKNMRRVINKEDAQKLIEKMPTINIIDQSNKNIEIEYKELLSKDSLESLVKIIKTSYLRNYERSQNKKRISDVDKTYFDKAEKRLYNELSVSLGLTYDETKDYIINSFTV